jgi:hypothetical protein
MLFCEKGIAERQATGDRRQVILLDQSFVPPTAEMEMGPVSTSLK